MCVRIYIYIFHIALHDTVMYLPSCMFLDVLQTEQCLHGNIHQDTAVNNVLSLDLLCLTASLSHRGTLGDFLFSSEMSIPSSLKMNSSVTFVFLKQLFV